MNQRGFMLLSAVFLTLIVSFVAMMTLQAMTRAKNFDAALRLQAINLANEQFAMIESLATQNNLSAVRNFNGNPNDLENYGLYRTADVKTKTPVEFKITTNISGEGNLKKAKVIVTWTGNENLPLEFEKIVRLEKIETE